MKRVVALAARTGCGGGSGRIWDWLEALESDSQIELGAGRGGWREVVWNHPVGHAGRSRWGPGQASGDGQVGLQPVPAGGAHERVGTLEAQAEASLHAVLLAREHVDALHSGHPERVQRAKAEDPRDRQDHHPGLQQRPSDSDPADPAGDFAKRSTSWSSFRSLRPPRTRCSPRRARQAYRCWRRSTRRRTSTWSALKGTSPSWAPPSGSSSSAHSGDKGNVLDVHGIPGVFADSGIYDGINDVLKNCPNIKTVGSVVGQFVPSVAKAVTLEFLGSPSRAHQRGHRDRWHVDRHHPGIPADRPPRAHDRRRRGHPGGAARTGRRTRARTRVRRWPSRLRTSHRGRGTSRWASSPAEGSISPTFLPTRWSSARRTCRNGSSPGGA